MSDKDQNDLVRSALGRALRLGGLVGRVGASVIGGRAAGVLRGEDTRRRSQEQNLLRNATRVVETLGEMKGAAMKVGQMLSLHEGLLPPEVAAVLSLLQQQAPAVPFEVMEYELRGELPDFDELFESLEPVAFAAASIGQVHRARLRDGRHVAVKIQYPEIDRIVRADVKNLKNVLGRLFALFTTADLDPVWDELQARLLEELDYVREARNIARVAEACADTEHIIVPQVIEEASTRHVLTMEYVEGIRAQQACSARYPQTLRDRWGFTLFEFALRGLFEHRFLHADPNLANFAFQEDGRIVVYDYGCMKQVSRKLASGYARLTLAGVDGRAADIPQVLSAMGVRRRDGKPVPRALTDPYAELLGDVARDEPPYRFGEDPGFYDRLFELASRLWRGALDIEFPKDVVFVNRTFAGHFGNLCKLGATGPWRELLLRYTEQYR